MRVAAINARLFPSSMIFLFVVDGGAFDFPFSDGIKVGKRCPSQYRVFGMTDRRAQNHPSLSKLVEKPKSVKRRSHNAAYCCRLLESIRID